MAVSLFRQWHEDPEGPNDKAIEIWHNQNWVPAFISDLKKGDFFLTLNYKLEPGKCYLLSSDIKRSTYHSVVSYVFQGLEVVQAPTIKDVPTNDVPKLG